MDVREDVGANPTRTAMFSSEAMMFSEQFKDFKWIKVKRYKGYDANISAEDNYINLDAHHTKETTFLIDKVRELAKIIDEKDELIACLQKK